MYQSNGNKLFDGQWKNDLMCGRGSMHHSNGTKSHDGRWKAGRFTSGETYNDAGILKSRGDHDEPNKYFRGIFYNDTVPDLLPTQTPNKSSEGIYISGKLQGEGKVYHKNGVLKYEGQLTNHALNGMGKLYYNNGNLQYHGNFRDGKYEGMGQKYDFYGTFLCNAVWKAGIIDRFVLTQDQISNHGSLSVDDKFAYVVGTTNDSVPNHRYCIKLHKLTGKKLSEDHYEQNFDGRLSKTYFHVDDNWLPSGRHFGPSQRGSTLQMMRYGSGDYKQAEGNVRGNRTANRLIEFYENGKMKQRKFIGKKMYGTQFEVHY